jgi:UDP-N-acetylglucosamine 4,6-dehydratase/5-epimerase
MSKLKKFFKGKSVLITGASGSIGSVIVKKLLNYNCKVIRAISNDENGIYHLSNDINSELKTSFQYKMKINKIRYLVGDIRDYKRNLEACKGVDIVIHAAALKHVPICEYNPGETKKTNINGTQKLIKAAIAKKVKSFLFISTDKAVNPVSLMGKSKLEAEKIVLKSNNGLSKTNFAVIRFGNIIGSRGSVLLNFLSQIKKNKEITVTNKDMTRFFITIKDVTHEIFNALFKMKGGELFTIKKMKVFKILDLAKALKSIFKYKKKIKIIGLREGEKLYEELLEKKYLNQIYFSDNLAILKKNNPINNFDTLALLKIFNSNTARHLNIEEIKRFLIHDVKLKLK